MGRSSVTQWGEKKVNHYKARLGAYLFSAYVIVYAGFIIINIANPLLMEKNIFAGLSLAVVYGSGLILLALVMGLIYNYLGSKKDDELGRSR